VTCRAAEFGLGSRPFFGASQRADWKLVVAGNERAKKLFQQLVASVPGEKPDAQTCRMASIRHVTGSAAMGAMRLELGVDLFVAPPL